MNEVGGYCLDNGEVLRISAGDIVFYVDDEQEYRVAMDYIISRGLQFKTIEVVNMTELI